MAYLVDEEGNPINSNNPLPIQDQGKYLDLGAVITATNMAAGATAFSGWNDNVALVRNITLLSQSDQQHDIGVTRRDAGTATSGIGTALVTNQPSTASDWRSNSIAPPNAILGYSARFYLKNSSASPNTVGNLRVQLMGV